MSSSIGRYAAEEASLEEMQAYLDGVSESVPKGAPESDFADPPSGLYVGDAKHARLAVQAVTSGLRGNKAQARSKPGVKSKIAAAIRKFYSGEKQKYYLAWLHSGKKPNKEPAGESRVSEMYIAAPTYSAADEARFPDVPTSPGVDLSGLMAARNDTTPVFVIRPLAVLDAVSENGLPYNQAIFNDVLTQVNSKRPVARRGHISDSDKDSLFPPDDGYWIGAVVDSTVYGTPTVFGKCYVVRGATRDMVLSRRATGTALSNSLWGKLTWQNGDPIAVDIESIDFVPEERAALRALGGEFVVTSEMESNMDNDHDQDDAAESLAQFKKQCAEMNPEALCEALKEAGRLREMAQMHLKDCEPQAAREMLSEGQRRHVAETHLREEATPEETYGMMAADRRKHVAECYAKETKMTLKPQEEEASVKESLAEMTSIKAQVTTMQTQLAEAQAVIKDYQRQDYERALRDTVNSFFSDWQVHTPSGKEKLTALSKNLLVLTVAEMAGSTKIEDVKPAADRAWESVKPLAEMTRAALAGPSAFVGTTSQSGAGAKRFGYDPTTGRYDDDFVRQATQRTGILGGRSGGVK